MRDALLPTHHVAIASCILTKVWFMQGCVRLKSYICSSRTSQSRPVQKPVYNAEPSSRREQLAEPRKMLCHGMRPATKHSRSQVTLMMLIIVMSWRALLDLQPFTLFGDKATPSTFCPLPSATAASYACLPTCSHSTSIRPGEIPQIPIHQPPPLLRLTNVNQISFDRIVQLTPIDCLPL